MYPTAAKQFSKLGPSTRTFCSPRIIMVELVGSSVGGRSMRFCTPACGGCGLGDCVELEDCCFGLAYSSRSATTMAELAGVK